MHANHVASSPDPPSYAAISQSPPIDANSNVSKALHPRVAVLLGVNARWHIPLLICRALSTGPAAWWGLRCAFTFLAELLRSEDVGTQGVVWTVEKRFRVTEVFLAILWVGVNGTGRGTCEDSMIEVNRSNTDSSCLPQCSAAAYLSYFFTDCLMSRW